jgi:hypothetical protein
MRVVASEWGTGQIFWSMMWFFIWFIWIWLLITVFVDLFRSSDLSGWAKALWAIFVILVPYLGVFVYIIVRGHKMSERAAKEAQQADASARAYIQDAAGTASSPADELTKLAALKAQGAISDAEYEQLKAKALAS